MDTRKCLAAVSFGVLGLVVSCTATLMSLAIWKLHKVAKVSFARRLNPWLTVIYIVSVLVWASSWFGMLLVFYISYDRVGDYVQIRSTLFCFQISINAASVIFAIMAFIMFRSS